MKRYKAILRVMVSVLSFHLNGCALRNTYLRPASRLQEFQIGDQRMDVVSRIGKPTKIVRSRRLQGNVDMRVEQYGFYHRGAFQVSLILGIPTYGISWVWYPSRKFWFEYLDSRLSWFGESRHYAPHQSAVVKSTPLEVEERRRAQEEERIKTEEAARQDRAESKKKAEEAVLAQQKAPAPKPDRQPVVKGLIPAPNNRKMQVAVIEFEGLGLSAVEIRFASDFFRSALVDANVFTIVDRGNMEKIFEELKFQQTGCTTQECAAQIGKILNVERIFTGAVTSLQGVYYLNVKFINVETSQVQATGDAEVSNIHEIKEAVKSLAEGFRKAMVPESDPAAPQAKPAAAQGEGVLQSTAPVTEPLAVPNGDSGE